MFFPRREAPLDLVAERLHGLRLSLNAPVVATTELPPGPARAAIAVHEEADGRPNVTVGVRSLRSGELVLYSYDGDLREESSVAVGTDAALSFAEGMGFLFDDDELLDPSPAARARALGLWNELMDADPADLGDAAAGPAGPGVAAGDDAGLDLRDAVELEDILDEAADGSEDELLLDDALDLADPEPTPPPRPRPLPAAEPLRLSKFRTPPPDVRQLAPEPGPVRTSRPAARPDAPARAPQAAQGSAPRGAAGLRKAALGRLKLIKRRKGGGSAEGERPNWILKLLSSF